MPSEHNLAETVQLLDSVAGQSASNQRALARKIGISVGLVNALVHRAVRKGLIKVKEAPTKRYAYYLTPKGFAQKSKLVAEYLEHSLTFFRTARQEYSEIFSRCESARIKRVVLCGAGELAEIATLAVNSIGVSDIAVLDQKTNQSHVAGFQVVRSFDDIMPGDVFVITDGQNPQETYDRLVAQVEQERVFAPPFLRISPASQLNRGAQ